MKPRYRMLYMSHESWQITLAPDGLVSVYYFPWELGGGVFYILLKKLTDYDSKYIEDYLKETRGYESS